MNQNEIVSLIGNVTFPKDEFVKRAVLSRDVWICQADTSLAVGVDYHDAATLHLREFQGPWVGNFPAPPRSNPTTEAWTHLSSHYFRVSYGSSVIENVVLVTIDGGPDATGGYRAQLPLPESGATVSRYRYGLALIVNDSKANLDFAMTTAGFGVASA